MISMSIYTKTRII